MGGVEIPKGTRIDVVSQKTASFNIDTHRIELRNTYEDAGLSAKDINRMFEISDNAPRAEYIPGTFSAQDILDIKPNAAEGILRPPVEDYLDLDYIEAHKQQFKNGAARFQKFEPSKDYNNGIVGGEDGSSFWLSKETADTIEDIAKGDNRLYETILGFDKGYLGDGPLYRLDASADIVNKRNLSIPSGNESGANSFWRPGGRTYPGDMLEGIMHDVDVNKGDITWKKAD
ncbi:hypothetical protein HO757_04220 [Streptococcus suis]|nr:hypothetical protein [Streptococcus suis]NQP75145.1 hypothetical protein [Streptococcus suis]NQP77251.1 hypothetical protein [Streptococcus suis]NQP91622.1 hypothetical protein [Streptococcus suis]NQP93546.1 hypothetical protein [Streptococcus suis]